jgi:hypothetical protein
VGVISGPLPGAESYRVRRRYPKLAWSPRMRRLDLNPFDALDAASFVDDLAGVALLPVVLVCALLLVLLAPVLLLAAELLLVLLLVVPLGALLVMLGVRRHVVLLVRQSDGEVVRSELVRGPLASWRAGRRLTRMVRDGEPLAVEPAGRR